MKCKARAKGSSQQCKKNAVTGYEVCATHGAGTRKRVLEGKRKSPALCSIKTGEYVSPNTEAIRKIYDPDYARCLEEVEQDPHKLMNLDEMAKRIYATLRSYDFREMAAERRDRALTEIAFAISRVEQVRLTDQKRRTEMVSGFVQVFVTILEEYVPHERIRDAIAKLRFLLGISERDRGSAQPEQKLIGTHPGS